MQMSEVRIHADSLSEHRKSYGFWVYLLESLSKHMKNKQELLDEVNGFQHISEERKEKFRKVINTVEEDLTEDQWRDYELALIEYQDTIEEYHTAIQKGMAKGMAKALVETAKAVKADGVDVSTISKWTGLSVAEIQRL